MRARASQTADAASTEDDEWPPVAQRIARARELAGLSGVEVAQRLGMTVHAYWDLEHFDDEAFTVVSFATLAALGRLLGVELRMLLLGADGESAPSLSFSDVSQRLAQRLERDGVTVDHLGDTIGWDIQPLLANSERFWEIDVEELFDIAEVLGFDWVAALPLNR
jgi:transcriptional regulator with XRE-family HTH domain